MKSRSDEPNNVFTRKAQRRSQHWPINANICNFTTWTIRTPQKQVKTGGELRCSGRIKNSCSSSGIRRYTLVTKPVISPLMVFFSYLTDFSYFPMAKQNPKLGHGESRSQRGCRRFQPFSMHFQLFEFLTIISTVSREWGTDWIEIITHGTYMY
jgi:hypothetical protein